MPSLHEAQLRHAQCYLRKLRQLAEPANPHSEPLTERIARLRADWVQLTVARNWSAANARGDLRAAEACSHFAYFGSSGEGSVRDFVQSPADRIRWLEGGLEAAIALNDRRVEAVHLTHLGLTHLESDHIEAAVESYKLAADVFHEIGDAKSQATAWDGLGMVFRYVGDLSQAFEYFRRARDVYRQLASQAEEGWSVSSMADCCAGKGDHDQAVALYEEAAEIYRALEDVTKQASTLRSLAIAHVHLGRHDAARRMCDEAVALFRQLKSPSGVFGTPADEIGRAYLQLGETRMAIELFLESLALQRQSDNPIGEGNTLLNLAMATIDTDRQTAAEYAQESASAFGQAGYDLGLALRLSALAYWTCYPELAIDDFERSIELLRDMSSQTNLGRTLRDLARLMRQLGRHDEALQYAEEALRLLDGLGAAEAEKTKQLLSECRQSRTQ